MTTVFLVNCFSVITFELTYTDMVKRSNPGDKY